MEHLTDIIQTTLSSFDFAYCIIVNVLTYIVIKIIDEANKEKEVKLWVKRVVLLGAILSTGVVYYIIGQDTRLIINSAILAPVSWSFVFKPLCKVFKIDYKQVKKIDKNIKQDNDKK